MQLPEDTYMHKGQRRKLLEELRTMGIQDERVLDAMDRVPRHYFLDSAFSQFAYSNKAFPIAAGQTISQPHTVAKQSELLCAKPGDNILEIGTGSGYQCAVLCALGFKVHSIERQKALFDAAGPLLKAMGWKPSLYYGDGYKGKPVFAPFDGIIITCGAPDVPQSLLGQLKVGGRMVIPVGDGDTQRMWTIDRITEREFTKKDHGYAAFVPMLEARARD